MKLLLHVCCAPCALGCIDRLREVGDEVTLFFSNSNIESREEWERRLAEVRKLAEMEKLPLVADAYNHEDWTAKVANGFENEPERIGLRCARCFFYSLIRASAYADANGFDEFTTTLTVSPHKDSALVFKAGNKAALGGLAKFAEWNFKKGDGFQSAMKRAKELGYYRQGFCGCQFSGGKRFDDASVKSSSADVPVSDPVEA